MSLVLNSKTYYNARMPPYPKPKKHKKRKQTLSSRRKYLENLLDRLTSQIVIMRDKGCITPAHCSGRLTCSHYYGRSAKRVRWDLRNCNCQCAGHNLRHNNFQGYYGEYMLAKYTKEDLKELAHLASIDHFKWTIPELELLVEEYQAKYRDALAENPTVEGHPELIIRKL